MLNIRLVRPEDHGALLGIYQPYIESTAITFEYETPSRAEFAQRVREVVDRLPWLVCEDEKQVIGYAYASPFKKRAAYRWDVELSIYLAQEHTHRGAGTALYRSLLKLLTLQGYYNAYAIITLPNDASLALHRAFGFTQAGILHNAGFKLGRWHDVIYLEKSLRPYGSSIQSPLPLASLDRTLVWRALSLQP